MRKCNFLLHCLLFFHTCLPIHLMKYFNIYWEGFLFSAISVGRLEVTEVSNLAWIQDCPFIAHLRVRPNCSEVYTEIGWTLNCWNVHRLHNAWSLLLRITFLAPHRWNWPHHTDCCDGFGQQSSQYLSFKYWSISQYMCSLIWSCCLLLRFLFLIPGMQAHFPLLKRLLRFQYV